MTVPNRPQRSPKIKGTVPRPPIGGTVLVDVDRPHSEKGTVGNRFAARLRYRFGIEPHVARPSTDRTR